MGGENSPFFSSHFFDHLLYLFLILFCLIYSVRAMAVTFIGQYLSELEKRMVIKC